MHWSCSLHNKKVEELGQIKKQIQAHKFAYVINHTWCMYLLISFKLLYLSMADSFHGNFWQTSSYTDLKPIRKFHTKDPSTSNRKLWHWFEGESDIWETNKYHFFFQQAFTYCPSTHWWIFHTKVKISCNSVMGHGWENVGLFRAHLMRTCAEHSENTNTIHTKEKPLNKKRCA